MPTSLPARRPCRVTLLVMVAFALSAVLCIVAIVDGAPASVEAAALVTSP